MSFPKKYNGNRKFYFKKSKYFLRYIYSISIALIILMLFSQNTEAVDAEVYATLDVHNIDHLLNYTTPNHIYVSGNITCSIEGLGNNIQQVDIELWINCQKYDGSVGPSHMTFVESGRKPFNLTITIPLTARNNSEDTFSITGHWQTQGSGYVIGDEGDVTPDSVKVTVRKEGLVRAPQETTPEYEELDPWWEEFGLQNIAVMILIPLIIIIAVVLYLYSRKKRMIE